MEVSGISTTPSVIRDVIPTLQDDHILPVLDTGFIPEMNSDVEDVSLLNVPQISSPLQDPPPSSINLTTRSLIDMELCDDVALSPRLLPSFVDLPKHREVYVRDFDESNIISNQAKLQKLLAETFTKMKEEQQNIKGELMNTLTTINQDLRLLYVDGQKDLQKEMIKQLEYHQTQNSANINWRLERFQNQGGDTTGKRDVD